MYVSQVRNVCQALPATIRHLRENGIKEDSRAGQVLVAPWPIMTVTSKPVERVLFSAVRDANPWLMMFEAIWMLAGRRDASPLDQFVKDFGSRYGEDDGQILRAPLALCVRTRSARRRGGEAEKESAGQAGRHSDVGVSGRG